MKFNKGAELDKQIYPEGESSWGLKYGFLDVEDVIDFIKEGDKIFYAKYYSEDNIKNGEHYHAVKLWDEFKELAGSKLMFLTEKSKHPESCECDECELNYQSEITQLTNSKEEKR